MIHAKEHPDFITVTCLEWKHILADNQMKEIIINSLRFLVKQNRIEVYAFCLMSNHIHIIWQMLGNYERSNVQRDFLKYPLTGASLQHVREHAETCAYYAYSLQTAHWISDIDRNSFRAYING